MGIGMELVMHKKSFQELTSDELYELLRIRNEVFVVEQNCVYQDLDNDDQQSIHLWLCNGDKVVALCRVCPAGTESVAIRCRRTSTNSRTSRTRLKRCQTASRSRLKRCRRSSSDDGAADLRRLRPL